MTGRLRVWAIGAGVVLGLAYALSPLAVWFAFVMIALLWTAARDLPADERRVVLAVLSVAIALRLVAVAILFIGADTGRMVSFFWDGDGVFLKKRAMWIRNLWLGLSLEPADVAWTFGSYGWTTYLFVIAYLQYLVGPSPYGIHLFNIAISLATAMLLYRVARRAYGAHAAILGLATLLFLPTPFMWSISALKESLYVFLEVCTMLAAILILRRTSVLVKIAALGLLVAAIEANGTVRAGAREISALAVLIGIAASLGVRRLSVAIVIVVLVTLGAYSGWRSNAVRSQVMTQLRTVAVQHIGHVHTEGNSYKLLDEHFYSQEPPSTTAIGAMTAREAARFVARACLAFVLVPLPSQVKSAPELLFLAQQVVWYALVVLALVGLAAGFRRDAAVTSLLAAFSAAGGVVIALASGNIGTMVRHRDTIVPFVVWLSALGAVELITGVANFGARAAARESVVAARTPCQ
jgi:hypothetical protein